MYKSCTMLAVDQTIYNNNKIRYGLIPYGTRTDSLVSVRIITAIFDIRIRLGFDQDILKFRFFYYLQ